MIKKRVPMRKCSGCGEMKPKRELVRVVKPPDSRDENGEVISKGEITIDTTGKKPGRGAYVCKNTECLAKAAKARRLERSFGGKVPEEVYDKLREELARGGDYSNGG